MASQDPAPQPTSTMTPGQRQLYEQLELMRAGIEQREREREREQSTQAKAVGTDQSRSHLEVLAEQEDEVFVQHAPVSAQPPVSSLSPSKAITGSTTGQQGPKLESVVMGPPPGLSSTPGQFIPAPSPLRQPKYSLVDGRLVDQSGNKLSSEAVSQKWTAQPQSSTSEDEGASDGGVIVDPNQNQQPANNPPAPTTPRAEQPPAYVGLNTPVYIDSSDMAHDSLNSTLSSAQWFYDDDGQDAANAQAHLGSEMVRAGTAPGHGLQSGQQRSQSLGHPGSGTFNPTQSAGGYSPARSTDGVRQRHPQSTSGSIGKSAGAATDPSTHSRGV